MMTPKYRGIEKGDVQILKKDGVNVSVIAGVYESINGPVTDLVIDVTYLDITLGKRKNFSYTPKKDYTTLCYVIKGDGMFLSEKIVSSQLVLFREIDKITITSNDELRFLLISGKPLREPIAWGGPIVMNTEEELRKAFEELRDGTFIKSKND